MSEFEEVLEWAEKGIWPKDDVDGEVCKILAAEVRRLQAELAAAKQKIEELKQSVYESEPYLAQTAKYKQYEGMWQKEHARAEAAEKERDSAREGLAKCQEALKTPTCDHCQTVHERRLPSCCDNVESHLGSQIDDLTEKLKQSEQANMALAAQVNAMREAMEFALTYLDGAMGCDHSENFCVPEHAMAQDFRRVLTPVSVYEQRVAAMIDALSYADILFREIKAWREAPHNDGFPHDTRLSVDDFLKKYAALKALEIGQ